MPFQQNQLDKLDTTIDKDDLSDLTSCKECITYREILIMYIDSRIDKLYKPMLDFDKVNYGLERSFRDGEVASLNKLKEIIS